MAASGDDTAKRYGISVNKLFPVYNMDEHRSPPGMNLSTNALAR
jgi:hypothetical protein